MTQRRDLRSNPRLELRYPIRVERECEGADPQPSRTVTQNVAARGAYFSTFQSEPFRVGDPVAVVLSVPHRLMADGQEVLLDMRGRGRVVRVEGPDVHRRYGEDGATLSGVAIEFSSPLSFDYRWV